MNLVGLCDRVIRFGFYLLFILVPLILTPWNYELFEYNKMMVTYGMTVIITAAWLVKSVHQKQLRIAKTPLDIPIALFVISQIVSAIFSMDPHVSWLGYYSRFNGGMWSVISYVLLYYAFISNLEAFSSSSSGDLELSKHESHKSTGITSHKWLFILLKVILATGSIVAAYGVAERLGIDKHLWVQDVQNRVFSTLGQPNWLAAYLVGLIPLSMGFGLKAYASGTKIKNRLTASGFGLLTILFFFVLLCTRSRSGLLGLAVADVAFWIFAWLATKKKTLLKIPFLAIHGAFALIIFFNGSYVAQIDRYFSLSGLQQVLAPKQVSTAPAPQEPARGPLLEVGGTESGTIRKYVWEGAVAAWKSSTKTMLIGTGTETFAFAFYRHRPAGHNLTSEWDFLYNKAHNEYLNYLATTGLFGLGSYVLFIGVFFVWFIKKAYGRTTESSAINHEQFTINSALFAGWLSILVTNFFGFSVVIMQIFLFLFPALCIAIVRAHDDNPMWYRPKIKLGNRQIITGVLIVAASTQLIVLYLHWKADTLFAAGYRLSRGGQYAAAQQVLARAISLNSGEPFYHDELANTTAPLAIAALEQQDATLASQLAGQSLAESDKAITISPNNVNFWKTRTKIYYSLANLDPKLNAAAVEALNRAQELSPNDPKIYYNLAILYGRDGDNEKALELLKKSKDLKPNYRDAYFGLHIFYTETNQAEPARAVLEEYLRLVDPNDKDFLERLGKQP